MKFFSFPQATLEKAIQKRILSLPPEHKEWFGPRWAQKPYKKAFIENKAMPLVTLLAKGKTCDDADFEALMADWDVSFYEQEAAVLRPMIEGDGLMQLMQKNMPEARKQVLLDRLNRRPAPSA
jgi:hypothetical protein